ncbi:MAG: class IV adenylate cyclase [Bacteroidales bacterium]|jgi:predicted adenylyl cyclase CyaB|nr:class IV adenylate cyclase [Bacteroidales bacterium]
MVRREVELKFAVSDENDLLNIFRIKGIEMSPPVVQIDTVFLRNGKNFDHLKEGEPVIRIRQEDETFVTTLKKYVKGITDRVEIECQINDGVAFNKYLELLDIFPIVIVKKSRINGKYKNATICFDRVDNLGAFIEIETITDDSYANQEIKRLESIATELGLDINSKVGIPYDVMLYNKLKGKI